MRLSFYYVPVTDLSKLHVLSHLIIGTIIISILFFYCFKFIYLFIYLFIYGCVGSSLLRVSFLQLRGAGTIFHGSAQASPCCGFFCCGAQALGMRASVVVACGLSSCGLRALEHRLSSCGTRAQLLHGMRDLPRPGIKPMYAALAGGFLTTVPPGKSHICILN